MDERNPPWSRDELILALDLYLKNRQRLPEHEDPSITELSAFLQSLAGASAGRLASFRNANGVYMKLANFRALDPFYTDQGKRGLSRGSRLDADVWNEFSGRPSDLSLVAGAIRTNITEAADAIDNDPIFVAEAAEGRLLARLHYRRERSANLVAAKKAEAMALNGRLECEGCNFDFVTAYGPHGSGLIEAHHLKPLHTLTPGAKTKLADLALLCANCHRIIHFRIPWLTLQQLKTLVEGNRGRQTPSGAPV